LYLEITLNSHTLLNIKQLKPFGAAFWALTIVINVLTTGTTLCAASIGSQLSSIPRAHRRSYLEDKLWHQGHPLRIRVPDP
jgi:hypothetical protein